jgi:hypothetical protein
MRRSLRLFALTVLALLGGCATAERLSAASDVHTLLIAIRDDDRPVFNAHVDRKALEGRIQASLMQKTRAAGADGVVAGLGMVLSGPISRAAGDVLIRPDVFRAFADYFGYSPSTPIPNQIALASVLSPAGQGEVCARERKTGRCLLTFAEEDGTWRLVDFDAERLLRSRRG